MTRKFQKESEQLLWYFWTVTMKPLVVLYILGICVCVLVAQLCLTLCDPIDYTT